MTLIKSSSQLAMRALPYRPARTSPEQYEDLQLFRDEAPPPSGDDGTGERPGADMAAHVVELEAALERASQAQTEACVVAEERGYARGLRAAETREQERMLALRTALADLATALERKIDDECDLAVEIARAALDRLFADSTLYHAMVVETAKRQTASLRRDTIIRLRVSETDFPDAAALRMLSDVDAGVAVERDKSLASGACVFDLTLGKLDASIAQQLAVVEQIFEQAGRQAASA